MKKRNCFVCGTTENLKYFIDGNDKTIDLCDNHGAEFYNAITEDGTNLLDTLKLELGERY